MILLNALALVLACNPQGSTPRYHVLLIGVPRPACQDFQPLPGVQPDLDSLELVLETTWHVPAADIAKVIDPALTTKKGIMGLIQSKLIAPCMKGDVVYFGYSGHGFQVVDLSKATQLSQAIVPSDAHYCDADKPDKGVKAGEVDPDSLLTGPEIGALFNPLRGKTDNVTLTFDSCHSGQITRGAFIVRGPKENPALDRYRGRGTPQQPKTLTQELGRRGLVCLSAAAPEQFALENSEGGVFTRAVVAALQKPGANRTYLSLFNEIRSTMASITPPPMIQDPQQEGDLDRTILGNQYFPPSSSYEVHMAGSRLVMSGGRIHGIKETFLIGIWPAGANTSGAPNWTATVTAVRTGESDLELSDDSKKLLNGDFGPLKANAQAKLIDGKPDGSIKVNIGDLPSEVQSALREQLKDTPMIDVAAAVNDFDFRVARPLPVENAGPNQWDLVDAAGTPTLPINLDGSAEKDAATISEELQSLARRKAVLALAPDQPATTSVEMRFIPVEMTAGNTVAKLLPDAPLKPGQDAGNQTKFAIQVRLQKSTTPGPTFVPFITLLNVNPHPAPGAQRVLQLWPAADSNGVVATADQVRRIRIEDGWRYLGVSNDLVSGDIPGLVDAFYVDSGNDGVGAEVFKLFATDQPENYGPLLDPKRAATRGASTPLGRTLRNFAKGLPRTRAVQATRGPATEHWCTAAITLNVVKN